MRHTTSPGPLRIRQFVKMAVGTWTPRNRGMVPGKVRKDAANEHQYQTRITQPVVLAYGCQLFVDADQVSRFYDAVAHPQTTGGAT